jgi:hypothetical protein
MILRCSNIIALRLSKRLNSCDARLARNESNSKAPKVYGWIEFPAWALRIRELQDPIGNASKQAKECEHYGSTIRLSDMVPNGRFSNLESKFQNCLVPFDCGGEHPDTQR